MIASCFILVKTPFFQHGQLAIESRDADVRPRDVEASVLHLPWPATFLVNKLVTGTQNSTFAGIVLFLWLINFVRVAVVQLEVGGRRAGRA